MISERSVNLKWFLNLLQMIREQILKWLRFARIKSLSKTFTRVAGVIFFITFPSGPGLMNGQRIDWPFTDDGILRIRKAKKWSPLPGLAIGRSEIKGSCISLQLMVNSDCGEVPQMVNHCTAFNERYRFLISFYGWK